jgi:hypothetical protein
MALNDYLKTAQRFLREANQDLINPADLVTYCNRARREVAMRSQAIRILTPISGQVISATVTNGGSGYTNPTVTISAPDFPSGSGPFPNGLQATALAQHIGSTVSAVVIQTGGYGYFQPLATITDPTGTGAEVTLSVSPINVLNQGQEVYNFSDVDLSAFPGVESVYWVRRASVIFSNWRYSVRMYSFTTYNAQIRTFPFSYQYAPFFGTQYGKGTNAKFYLYPQPSQQYQMEWDTYCLPSDLTDDTSPEAIPDPFTDGVPWLMAYYSMIELQNYNAAAFFKGQFDEWISRYIKYTNSGRAIDAYGGRW